MLPGWTAEDALRRRGALADRGFRGAERAGSALASGYRPMQMMDETQTAEADKQQTIKCPGCITYLGSLICC